MTILALHYLFVFLVSVTTLTLWIWQCLFKKIILKIEKKVNVCKILKIHPRKSTKGFVDNIVWCSACDQEKVQLQLNSVTVNEQTDLLEILEKSITQNVVSYEIIHQNSSELQKGNAFFANSWSISENDAEPRAYTRSLPSSPKYHFLTSVLFIIYFAFKRLSLF